MFTVHCFNGGKKDCRKGMEGAEERNKGDATYETNYSLSISAGYSVSFINRRFHRENIW
jgi:hypothetical protein